MKAGKVRERLLEKASLEHWRRRQGSREDKGHMLVAAWYTGKRPVLPAPADYLPV